eukprot:scaffold52077_cov52-Attheya_sp.AAC.1
MSNHILEKCNATLAKVANIEATVKAAVKEAYQENIDKQADENTNNGHPLSAESMQGILKHFFTNFELEMKKNMRQEMQEIQEMKTSMQQEMQEVREEIQEMRSRMAHNHEFDSTSEKTTALDADLLDYSREEGESYGKFTYDDGRLSLRHWHVPKDFEFPQEINLTTGWGLWLSGMPSKRIRPFRGFKKAHLPRHLHSQFMLHWKPIFDLMEMAPNMDHGAIASRPTPSEINDSLEMGRSYLRSDRLSYVFENKKKKPDTWAISTWSKHCQRSMILKHGSEKDKSFFPIETSTRYNQARSTGLLKRKRQRKNTKTAAAAETNSAEPTAATGTAAAASMEHRAPSPP